ncbi:MAG: M16 family metallopeptidase [Candidatus Zixiibacteriota bacterium]
MFNTLIILVALGLVLGCGQPVGKLEIGPDGYGKTTLANGVTVLVNYDTSTLLTSARILIGGGVLTETGDNNGLNHLTMRMLLKGNADMNASEISEQLEFFGANVSVEGFRDYGAISFTSLSENFDEVFAIIARSLLTPTFPEEELIKLKQEIEGDIKSADDNQSQASSKLLWETTYGKQGYGLPTLGTVESIAGITVEDIRQQYDRYVGGSNVIVSFATDIGADQLMAMVKQNLGGLKAEAAPVPVPSMTLQQEKEGFLSYERNQSFIFMGVALDHLPPSQTPYLILLNNTMGGGVGSRLWFLRQDEKLAYAVYTQYILDRYGAFFRAAIGTDTSKVTQALASLDREWKKMVDQGLTAEELTDAKVNMKNNLIFSIDRKSNRANNMAYYEYIGYDYRYVLDLLKMADDVTLVDLNAFIKEKFTDNRRFISIVGKK